MGLINTQRKEVKESWFKTFPIKAFTYMFFIGLVVLQGAGLLWNKIFIDIWSAPVFLGPFITAFIVLMLLLLVMGVIFKTTPLEKPKDLFIWLVLFVFLIVALFYIQKWLPWAFGEGGLYSLASLFGAG